MSNKNDQQLPMMKRKKQQTNLYNALVYDQHNIYAIGRVTKTLIKKAKNSLYKKDIVFVNVYNILENKKFLPEKLLLNTSFVGKKDIMHTTLYSFHRPFETLQADIAYISFLARSAVDTKFCLLLVDLFTLNIYTYRMEKRNLLAKKMELIYKDIEKKRLGKMRLQTDQEFKQRNIEQLNTKFNVEMYSTHLRGGKAFAAEQKIGELKKLLLRSKRTEKFKGKRIKPNELTKKATFNSNNTRSAKYGYLPEQIEEQALNPDTGKYFQEVYEFHSLIKVKEDRDRVERFDSKIDRHKKQLRDPLKIGEKVLVLVEWLRKKDAPGRLSKKQQKIKSFLTETELT